ncbi:MULTISPECIES: tetratricopeptide repeat protein [unclassified Helicobacter]|uniref:tetratricopeptide repeat protein n=1 Tax=unclassified Helicobacter TaxID=2593540 RepID=UPI000CF048E3|nr:MULTISPECIES: tetratricopeptide repeat protein [unclassified Helicobacter]
MAKKPPGINSLSDDDTMPQGARKLPLFFERISSAFRGRIESFRQFPKKKKIVFLGIGGVLSFIILASILLLLFFNKKPRFQYENTSQQEARELEDEIEITTEFLQALPKVETRLSQVDDTNLNLLIQKANILYNDGNTTEALNIFNRIATFSQGLANYNLGVMQIKQKDYKEALKSFENSINSGEDISLSALNAAVSARYMGDKELFSYYLHLATSRLPEENQKPFYSYLYALVNFYNENYFAALSSITNPISDSYVSMSSDISAKSFLVFGDDENAIGALEKQENNKKDIKNLGLLYARTGNYDRAKEYLTEYIKNHQNDLEAMMALQILYLKTHDFYQASNILEQISNNSSFDKRIIDTYPIKVVLQPKLFSIDIAQQDFVLSGIKRNYMLTDKVLFYFAPYKVFSVKDTLDILRESGIFSNYNVVASEEKLLQSVTIAQINKDIAQALVAIYQNDLRSALKILQVAAQHNPNHAVLHYNLGLVYAQMDDLGNAYRHLLKSYHLNTNSIDTGLYAILASRLLDKDSQRLQRDITQNFERVVGKDSDKRDFLLSLLGYLNQNITSDMKWVENTQNKLPIYYALRGVFDIQTKKYLDAHKSFSELDLIYPNDLVVKTLKNLTQGTSNANFKQNALRLHNMLTKEKINLEKVYNGPALSRELYAYISFITGSLQVQENALKQKLISSLKKPNGALQTLALINLYQHKFEQAYSIYDTLINNLGEQDSKTQFLGSVALIGTGNYDNATLLLQLSKMDSEASFETKYVLGMLYQQAGNFKAAASHYAMIAGKPFNSNFFDFEIDLQKIADSKIKDE